MENFVAQLLKANEQKILTEWLSRQLSAITLHPELMRASDLRDQCHEFLQLFVDAAQGSGADTNGTEWQPVKEMLASVSQSRAKQGFRPSETAIFVFSLKQPLFNMLRLEIRDAQELARAVWSTTMLLDSLGLYATEVHHRSREAIIGLQQEELLELSTPVMELWDNILVLPLIGTLDSARTQIVMESLLEKLVQTSSKIAIIDITGVPTVDTLVAQHLIKTVAAARLMGAECIISGIRPQIAQTIVHLGIDLSDMLTKATIADAFIIALKRTGMTITNTKAVS